jgi:hypothetical protein
MAAKDLSICIVPNCWFILRELFQQIPCQPDFAGRSGRCWHEICFPTFVWGRIVPPLEGEAVMKMVMAIFKPFKLDDVRDALMALGIQGLTVSEV